MIDESGGTGYLLPKNTFLHSAITAETDFLKFFANAAQDFIEKKWSFQSFFKKDRILNFIAIYTFRFLLTVCIVVFLYLALMTTTLDLKNDEISGRDFYFIKSKIESSFQNFRNFSKERHGRDGMSRGMNAKDAKSKK